MASITMGSETKSSVADYRILIPTAARPRFSSGAQEAEPIFIGDSSDSFTCFKGSIDSALSRSKTSPVRVAFDCEGVNLSRIGTIEIVSVHFVAPVKHAPVTYLVDVGSKGSNTLRKQCIGFLRSLLTSPTVEKVVHDCRKDSDALYHLFGISLANVHDTSCYQQVISGNHCNPPTLNSVLHEHKLPTNTVKDNSIYRHNASFWAARPLSAQMIKWASMDVKNLHIVAHTQTEKLKKSQRKTAKKLSKTYVESLRSAKLKVFTYNKQKKLNWRALQHRTKTTIYSIDGEEYDWAVYYESGKQLAHVKTAMGARKKGSPR